MSVCNCKLSSSLLLQGPVYVSFVRKATLWDRSCCGSTVSPNVRFLFYLHYPGPSSEGCKSNVEIKKINKIILCYVIVGQKLSFTFLICLFYVNTCCVLYI